MSSKGVPHRCEPCVEAASYTGFLVFEGQKPPSCKTHKIPLTPVPEINRNLARAFTVIREAIA